MRSILQKITRDSLAYMSPEQVGFYLNSDTCPKKDDAEYIPALLPGDIWSLGVTALELTQGGLPINAEKLNVEQIR